MQIVDELTGDMTISYGDNGEYTVFNIPTDKNYMAYFIVFDKNRKNIFQIQKETLNQDFVTFIFKPSDIEKLVIPKDEESQEYFFDIKLRYGNNEIEDTLVLGNKSVYDKNKITVVAKGNEE